MNKVAFDTLRYAETLKGSGVPDKQAKAQAEALASILKISNDNLASKEDIHLLDVKIDAINGKISLLVWLIGIILASVMAMVFKILLPI